MPRSEQPKGTNAADIGKLVLAVLVLVAGMFAYYWFGGLATFLRRCACLACWLRW